MRRYRLYQVDAFTAKPLTGNAAGVVPEADGLSGAEMQAIARELNNSETAFVFAPDGDDHEVRIRFFTPTTEVPSCGHATIAAHYVRAVEKALPTTTVIQKIGAGILPVDIEKLGGDYRVSMTQGAVEIGAPLAAEQQRKVVEALGATADDRDPRCPIQQVSTGHGKILVGLSSLCKLHALRPDMSALAALSGEVGCNGYFVFVLTGGDHYLAHGRMFAPAIGIDEDPVTGNGNGPLGAYLVHHGLAEPEDGRLRFVAAQGEAMGRPGEVEVTVDSEESTPVRVRVSGRAVIVFRGSLEI